MTARAHFFDINSDEAFFLSLQRAASKLRSQKVKDTGDVLYLLMGTNHLRDWIAPGFGPVKKATTPTTPEQQFHCEIYGLREFKIVNALCNRSKHMNRDIGYRLKAAYGATIDDYPEIDSVFDFDNGPPTGYSVDDTDLFDIVDVVLRYYQFEWYNRPR